MAERQMASEMVAENAPESGEGYLHLIAPAMARPLYELIRGMLQEMGFRLVRVSFTGSEGTVLQIMAEPTAPPHEMGIEDCQNISHAVSAILDVEEVQLPQLSDKYQLEVSSPGLNRPLTSPFDFQHWAGYEVKIELADAVEIDEKRGQKKIRARLQGREGENIILRLWDSSEPLSVPIANIVKAHLAINEEQMKEIFRNSKKKQ
ncbi:MAG: ribosome maturation factor RimP [Parvibaculales bacterium]